MRKLLLASAAVLGASGGLAHAQTAPVPSQGRTIAPYGSGPAANNNNNSWGIANTPSGSAAAGAISTIFAPNTIAVPEPGTIVIRLNGRVEVDVDANFSSFDTGRFGQPVAPATTPVAGTKNGFKVNPVGVGSYMRLYPGFDGRAANGLRYGAAIELRENFGSATANGLTSTGATATSPSSNTSGQTVMVRRAFTYLASDQAGIVRLGQTDGVVGLFDNCIFTSQCWDAGVGTTNGGQMQSAGLTGAVGVPFVWLSQAGAEYGNNKIVYLSPQFYGLDFGVQYAPSMGNVYQNQGFGAGCTQASAGCISQSSGNDPTRWLNQLGVGARFQQTFGGVDVKAFGFYETAGKENLTTGTGYTSVAQARAGTGGASAATLRYDNLGFYQAGIAVTAANVTFAVDYIGGAVNGQLAMRPTGGVNENAIITGLTYANGPVTLGVQVGVINSQGDARLTGVSQRREYELAMGGNYKLAPGVNLVGEYMYTQRHQGGFDFAQGAVNNGTRDAKGQGFLFATVLTW